LGKKGVKSREVISSSKRGVVGKKKKEIMPTGRSGLGEKVKSGKWQEGWRTRKKTPGVVWVKKKIETGFKWEGHNHRERECGQRKGKKF